MPEDQDPSTIGKIDGHSRVDQVSILNRQGRFMMPFYVV